MAFTEDAIPSLPTYPIDLLNRRLRRFTLWTPGRGAELVPGSGNEPYLLIGTVSGASPPSPPLSTANSRAVAAANAATNTFTPLTSSPIPLKPHPTLPDLWELDPTTSFPWEQRLREGVVYRYWFRVLDTTPEVAPGDRKPVLVTDPLAYAVDYGVRIGPYAAPAGLVRYVADVGGGGPALMPCDVDGSIPSRPAPPPSSVPPPPKNNQLVIYELPTTWTRAGPDPERGGSGTGDVEVDVGTFADVAALWSTRRRGSRFAHVAAVRERAHCVELGVNALELLPVADAKVRREWGYATTNYFAPDADLGTQRDLVELVELVQAQGARWFADTVMAFGYDGYAQLAFAQMHIRPDKERGAPDAWQSHTGDTKVLRDGYGGRSWRYYRPMRTYDPVSGEPRDLVAPSGSFHAAHQARWFRDFAVGGFRIDSVNNIGNYDFVRYYRDHAWALYNATASHDPARFLVIGEELSMPLDMLAQGCLDALWNERFQERCRAVILGHGAFGDNFEWTVRKLIDCRLDGPFDGNLRFTDPLSQSVNYITSHDVQGEHKSKARLLDYLNARAIWDAAPRIRLAHVLLLTSLGIPMILAGEEFADKSDRDPDDWKVKQTDPVNWERLDADPWRRELFEYVARLVRLRTRCPGLAINETHVIHVDQFHGARIMAWVRGSDHRPEEQVVVVANFSDLPTPGHEYVVSNWPGQRRDGWREVSQGWRDVPPDWVGREPLFPWEAKVYTRWRDPEEGS